jgi:FAD synthetase
MNVLWYNKRIGGVAEWSNALVLKTRVSQGTVSSNLTPSALWKPVGFNGRFATCLPTRENYSFPDLFRMETKVSKLSFQTHNTSSMTRIMVFGTFDMIHPGHEDLFYQARALAPDPYLIVSIARDSAVLRHKGKAPRKNEEERRAMLETHSDIDKVVLGNESGYIAHIHEEKPDIIALGYDQHGEYVDHLEADLKEAKLIVRIVRLEPFQEHAFKTSKLQS